MLNHRNLLVALFLCGLIASHASAELARQLKINGQVLQLNGSGTRTKMFIQIYESGLYLLSPSRDAQAILAADEWMAVRVNITTGLAGRDAFVASLQDCLNMSTGGKTDEIANEMKMFVEILKDEVNKNDTYDFVHVPGRGITIFKNSAVQGSIPGMAFKKALFGIWLSDTPIDKNLRQAMLSGSAPR